MEFKEIKPKKVSERLNKGESLYMIDVREPEEWKEGHVAGAKHIPLGELEQRYQEVDPSQETIVICRSGNRSRMACEFLSEKGFKVLNMSGGLNSWEDKLVRD